MASTTPPVVSFNMKNSDPTGYNSSKQIKDTFTEKSDIFITEHFKWSEFACHDGTPVPDFLRPNVTMLCTNLEVIREAIQMPIMILSGYRTKEYNRILHLKDPQVSLVSQHLQGKAADISLGIVNVKGTLFKCPFDPVDLANLIESLIERELISEGGLGIYSNFIHYDIRSNKARWDFSGR